MEQLTIDKKELKSIINDMVSEQIMESITDILSKQKEYLETLVIEAIENISLANAIEEGMKTENVDLGDFMERLDSKIQTV